EIISACGGSQQAFQMLMLEHLDHLASTAATAISNITFDKVIVGETGSQNGKGTTANFLQSFARSLPPMMQIMKDIGGVEVPEYLAKLSPEQRPPSNGPAAEATPRAHAAAVEVPPGREA